MQLYMDFPYHHSFYLDSKEVLVFLINIFFYP
nr:MAG TPA: hypothetical protein [Caudoviricetes sp.]